MKRFFVACMGISLCAYASDKSLHMINPKFLKEARAKYRREVPHKPEVNISYIAREGVVAPHTLREVALYHGQDGFVVNDNGEMSSVPAYDTDRMTRQITKANLFEFFNAGGRIHLSQASDGSFLIRSSSKGQGGGVIMAHLFGYATAMLGFALPIAIPYMVLNSEGVTAASRSLFEATRNIIDFLEAEKMRSIASNQAFAQRVAAAAAAGATIPIQEPTRAQDVMIHASQGANAGPFGVLSTVLAATQARDQVADLRDAAGTLSALGAATRQYGPAIGIGGMYAFGIWKLGPTRSITYGKIYLHYVAKAIVAAEEFGMAIPYI